MEKEVITNTQTGDLITSTLVRPVPDTLALPAAVAVEPSSELKVQKAQRNQIISVRVEDAQKLRDLSFLAHYYLLIEKDSVGEFLRYCIQLGYDEIKIIYESKKE